jgi:hypothetical protein
MDNDARFPSLPARYDEALRSIVTWTHEHFSARAILVSGSIIRGNPDAGSDFDIWVVNREAWRQRVQRFSGDVPCEIFINPLERIRAYFASEQREGRPVTAHMIATGWVISDRDAVMPALRDEANTWLARGPTTTDLQLVAMKYNAADFIENARDVVERDPLTGALLASKAVEQILAYWLLAQGRLVPRRKELLQAVSLLEPLIGELVQRALGNNCARERVNATAELARYCLGVAGFFAWESAREPC